MKALTTLPGLATGVALCVVAPAANQMLRAGESELTPAQSDYLEQCGGCHGIQGNTAPAPVPVLRARVGYFMCTEAGRRYLIRLPNVSYARVDDESLRCTGKVDLSWRIAPRNFAEGHISVDSPAHANW